MAADKWIVTIVGIAAMAWVGWYFFVAGEARR